MSPGGNSYKISIPISLSGDTQLQRVLDNIKQLKIQVEGLGSPMRTLATESNAVAVAMGLMATNSRKAGEGIKRLTDQIDAYIRAANRAASVSAPAPGINPANTQSISSAAGRSSGRDVGGFLARIGGRLGGQFSGIPGGGFIGAQTVGALGIGGGLGVGLGVAAVGALSAYEITKQANETAKYAQEQSNLSKQLGTTVQFTQLLGRVSEVSGTQATGLYTALKGLNKEITSGGDESKKTQRALADLGLSAGLAFEKPEAQINDVLKALWRIGDESERERLGFNLLGDSYKDFAPLVDTFSQLSDEVQKSGAIIDDQGIKKLLAYKQATGELGLAWDALRQQLSLGVVGPITFVVKTVTGAFQGAASAGSPLSSFGGWTGAVVGALSGAYMASGYGTPPGPSPLAADIADPNGIIGAQNLATADSIRSGRFSTPLEAAQDALQKAKSAEQSAFEGTSTGRVKDPGAQRKAEDAVRRADEQVKYLQKLKTQQEARNRFFESLNYDNPDISGGTGKYAKYGIEHSEAFKVADELDRAARTNPAFTKEDIAYGRSLREQGVNFGVGEELYGGGATRRLAERQRSGLRDFQAQDEERRIREEGQRKGQEDADRRIQVGLRGSQFDIGAAQSIGGARIGYGSAISSANLEAQRVGLSAQEYNRRQLQIQLSTIGSEGALRAQGLRSGSAADTDTAGRYTQLGVLAQGQGRPYDAQQQFEKAQQLRDQAAEKDIQAISAEIEARTKSVEAISKFNTSIDEAAKNVRDQISGGFTSLVLAAQQPGGRALRPAARSFLEGQESTILHNTADTALQAAGFAHGNPLGVSGPLGNILKGTILGQVDNKKDLALNSNTAALLALTSAITGRPAVLSGGGVAAGDIPTVSGVGTPSGVNPALLVPGAQAVAQALSGGGLSASSALSSSAGLLSAFAKGAGGNFASGAASNLSGYGLSVALDPGFNAATRLGAGLGFAGELAGGAAVIDRGLTKGGLGGDLTAAGGAAGVATTAASSVAKLLGDTLPSFIPIVGSLVAAVLPLIGGIFGSNPQKRQNQITSELSTNQYIAPQALNITESSNGTLGSFDARGNYRTTNLNAYPTVSQGSVYTQTHGLFGGPPTYYTIPGRTITPYSGNATGNGAAPVAGGPAATNITINAMDADSMTQFLVKNHPAVGAALTAHLYSGDTATHSAIKFAVPGAR